MKKKALTILGIWIGFTLFDLFVVRDASWITDNGFGERFVVNYVLSSLAFLAFIILMTAYLLNGRKKTILAFIIIFVPLMVQVCYFKIYRKFVSAFGFRAFFEDPAMVFSLWLEHIPILKLMLTAAVVLVAIMILKRVKGRFPVLVQGMSGFILFIVMILMVFSWYSVPIFQNSILAYGGSYLELLKQKSYERFKFEKPEITPLPTDAPLPDIIFIIGESTVLHNLSLFGYERDTTPGLVRLEKENKIVAFDNCISIGLQTRLSVPYMMAGLQGIDPKGYIYTCPTILNYAKARGYHTAFITAQDLYWGRLTEILIDKDVDEFENGTYFKPETSVRKGADDLDLLERGIIPYLKQSHHPFFLVIQMDGSHYPFSEHCEPQYKKFLPEDKPNGVNAYDNTIVYSDIFLTRLIELARRDFPSSWVFFSPDHGQNLGGENGFYNDSFSSRVIHNAMFISAPPDYIPLLREKRHAPLSQSDILPTMLDLMDLKPVKPIDGLSLLGPIPEDRLRVCSAYMPTFHNVPESVLVFNDLSYYYIDQARGSVTLTDGKSMIKFDDLKPEYKEMITRRM